VTVAATAGGDRYSNVPARRWREEGYVALSRAAKVLLSYLEQAADNNAAGVYRPDLAVVRMKTGPWEDEGEFQAAREELHRGGFAWWWGEWLWVLDYTCDNNPDGSIRNPSVAARVVEVVSRAPEGLRAAYWTRYGPALVARGFSAERVGLGHDAGTMSAPCEDDARTMGAPCGHDASTNPTPSPHHADIPTPRAVGQEPRANGLTREVGMSSPNARGGRRESSRSGGPPSADAHGKETPALPGGRRLTEAENAVKARLLEVYTEGEQRFYEATGQNHPKGAVVRVLSDHLVMRRSQWRVQQLDEAAAATALEAEERLMGLAIVRFFKVREQSRGR